MMENDTQNSQQAASTALHNAPKLAKIAQAGVQGGPAGAATEAAVQYCKEILVVAIAVLLLPVLVLLMLPGAIFGTLTQPSTAVNDDLEVAANVMQLRNAVSDILQLSLIHICINQAVEEIQRYILGIPSCDIVIPLQTIGKVHNTARQNFLC